LGELNAEPQCGTKNADAEAEAGAEEGASAGEAEGRGTGRGVEAVAVTAVEEEAEVAAEAGVVRVLWSSVCCESLLTAPKDRRNGGTGTAYVCRGAVPCPTPTSTLPLPPPLLPIISRAEWVVVVVVELRTAPLSAANCGVLRGVGCTLPAPPTVISDDER
jgi:hypothetical protein